MKALLMTFAGILILIIGFFVLRGLYDGSKYAVAAAADSARSSSFSVSGTGPRALGPYTIHGLAIIDTSQGLPTVPYIAYINTDNATSTKQIVYADARACAPGAGDYPCVTPFSASQGYPVLTSGQRIVATGYIYENRFLVSSLSRE